MKKQIKYLILYFVLANIQYSVGQDFAFEQYKEEDGLPSNMTYEMVQDSSGMLWIGTENGLVSYDGVAFQRYSHPEFINNDIIEIAVDPEGRVFFMNIADQLAVVEQDSVIMIALDPVKGKLLDIYTYENKTTLRLLNLDMKKETFEIQSPSKGEFKLVQDINYIQVYENEKYTPYTFEDRNDDFHVYIEGDYLKIEAFGFIAKSESGKMYYNRPSLVLNEVDSTIYEFYKKDGLERVKKYNDVYFVFFERGLKVYYPKTQEVISLFGEIVINTSFIDREENVWLSSRADGLFKIPLADLSLSSKKDQFTIDVGINDIIQDDAQNIYLGTILGDIFVYNKDKELIKTIGMSSNSRPINFYKYKNKIIGYSDLDLCFIDPNTMDADLIHFPVSNIKSLMMNDEIVLFGTRIGYSKLEIGGKDKIQNDSRRFLRNERINVLFFDENTNVVYIGVTNGLYKADLETWDRPQKIENIPNFYVSCIHSDRFENLWVGTKGSGLIKFQGDSIVGQFTVEDGLASNNINSIRWDEESLLVSTAGGINVLDSKSEEIRKIGGTDKYTSKEIYVCEFANDEYWVGSISGLTTLKKDQHEKGKDRGPILTLKNMYANGQKVSYTEDQQLNHDINTILFDFDNISFNYPNNKSIKYRINDSEEWTYTSESLIRLQSLKRGTYDIEAVGINSLSEEGNTVQLRFTIHPPWWETTWARVLGGLMLFGGFYIVLERRGRRIRKEELIKREYLGQINAIKDQALQLQMNPHFIFNSLNAIQGFIGTDEEEKAMNFLARFARLIRLIFEHSKGNSISFEEELEFIQLYLDLEKLRFKDKVKVQIEVDPELELNKDIIRVPPLLIQPIVENSFKHGLFHKKGQGVLGINYSLEGRRMIVVIEDNGIGRKKSAEIRKRGEREHNSSGIKTTQERIDLLNFGNKDKRNSIIIEDLYDANGTAKGTRTILNIEIKENREHNYQ